jgi:nicotinate phosphoribosyltransferase
MIITSLLDTDLYKFTMMQVVLHHFPAATVEYRFRCRTRGVDLVPYIDEIRDEVRGLCALRFTDVELDYLRRMRFIKSDFVDFLALFHLNEKYISITPSPKGNGEIDIVIEGPWLHTILFEIPVLAIVNEVYFRNTQRGPTTAKAASGCATRSSCSARSPSSPTARSPTTARAAASRRCGTRKSR